jgi:hypothetical protein
MSDTTPTIHTTNAEETHSTSTSTETKAAETKSANPIQEIVDRADIEGATAHHVVADLIAAIQQLAVRAQISTGIAQKIFFKEAAGLKGQIQNLLNHAEESVIAEVHALLASKVTIPETTNNETTNNETTTPAETDTAGEKTA